MRISKSMFIFVLMCFVYLLAIGCGSSSKKKDDNINQGQNINTIPSAPTGVTVTTAQSGTDISIAWNNVQGATSYNIYWATSAGVNKNNGTKITSPISPYNHTGLTAGTAYYYVVTAVNSIGESSESNEASATAGVNINAQPSIPTGINTSISGNQVTITWNTVLNATSFNIYMATTSGVNKDNYNTLPNNMMHTSDTNSFIHQDLEYGTKYYIVITSVNSNISFESDESSEIIVAMPSAPIPGQLAVAGGVSASQAVMSQLTETDEDADSTPGGATELNESLPELEDSLNNAPSGYEIDQTAKIPTKKGRIIKRFGYTDLLGPVIGPDSTDGWYYWVYAYGDNSWKIWVKCSPAHDLSKSWPLRADTWWWAWTGESGIVVGYKWIMEYSMLNANRIAGTYKFEISSLAIKYAGSWFEGGFDYTNFLESSLTTNTNYNYWKSHWIRSSGEISDYFGRYSNTVNSIDKKNYTWNYKWYFGTGTTDDPEYAERPEYGDAWATTQAGNGLIYWGEGTSIYENGVSSWEYCSYRYDKVTNCYTRPKFSWKSGCVRSLAVVQGDFENADEANAVKIWEIISKYSTGSYISSPVKFRSYIENANVYINEGSIKQDETYTVILTKIDGIKYKKKFTGSEISIYLDVDGDTCGGQIQKINVYPENDTTYVGQSVEYYAVATDNYDNPIESADFEWFTDNSGIASIDIDSGIAIGVSPGTAIITAKSGDIAGTASLLVKQVPIPDVPTELNAVPGNGQVVLNWNMVNLAASYNLYYAIGSTVSKSDAKIENVTTNSYTLLNLTNDTQYTFAVASVNASGVSDLSSPVSATPRNSTSGAKSFSKAVSVLDASYGNLSESKRYLFMNSSNIFVTWAKSFYPKGISLDKSSDGQTFGTDNIIYTADTYVGGSTAIFDMPQIIGSENIFYLFFTASVGSNNNIYFIKTTDGGITFNSPVLVKNNCTLTKVTFGRNGSAIYIIYYDSSYKFIYSSDGGQTWSNPLQLTGITTEPNIASSGDDLYIVYTSSKGINFLKVQGETTLADPVTIIDNTNFPINPFIGINGGNIFVAYVGWLTYSNNYVYITKSTDGGLNFSTPLKVSNNTTYFTNFPKFAFDSPGGMHFIWTQGYNTYSDGYDEMQEYCLYYAFSSDNAATFTTPTQIAGGVTKTSVTNPIIAEAGGKIGVGFYLYNRNDYSYTIFFSIGQ